MGWERKEKGGDANAGPCLHQSNGKLAAYRTTMS
jgi:hypothetical protein